MANDLPADRYGPTGPPGATGPHADVPQTQSAGATGVSVNPEQASSFVLIQTTRHVRVYSIQKHELSTLQAMSGDQLSQAYLGIAQELWGKLPVDGVSFVTVLVTNARLSIVQNAFDRASVITGLLEEKLVLKDVQELVLKHPFPTPEGVTDDFRRKLGDSWHQLYTESLYVVNADALVGFLDPSRREDLALSRIVPDP